MTTRAQAVKRFLAVPTPNAKPSCLLFAGANLLDGGEGGQNFEGKPVIVCHIIFAITACGADKPACRVFTGSILLCPFRPFRLWLACKMENKIVYPFNLVCRL